MFCDDLNRDGHLDVALRPDPTWLRIEVEIHFGDGTGALSPAVTVPLPAVSNDLRVVLETAMAKDRDHRYQTAGDLAEELRRVRGEVSAGQDLKPVDP